MRCMTRGFLLIEAHSGTGKLCARDDTTDTYAGQCLSVEGGLYLGMKYALCPPVILR
jgi:hypothetical protein